jgi:hypothetical protein
MRGVRIALGAGLTLLAVAIALTLAHSPLSVAASSRPAGAEEEQLSSTRHATGYCQAHETLPHGTSAIRVSLGASIGPRVRVAVLDAHGHALTGGAQEAGWTGSVVTVPVGPLRESAAGVTVCVSFQLAHETVSLLGARTAAASAARQDGRPLKGRMWIEYLRPGPRTWASLAPRILRDMGFARPLGGEGVAVLALTLLAAVAALACGAVLVELR